MINNDKIQPQLNKIIKIQTSKMLAIGFNNQYDDLGFNTLCLLFQLTEGKKVLMDQIQVDFELCSSWWWKITPDHIHT